MELGNKGLHSLIATYCNSEDFPKKLIQNSLEDINKNSIKNLDTEQSVASDEDEFIDVVNVDEEPLTCLLTINPNIFESYDRSMLNDNNNNSDDDISIDNEDNNNKENEGNDQQTQHYEEPTIDSTTGECTVMRPQFTVSQLQEVNIKIEKASKMIKELLTNYEKTGINLTEKEKDDILNLFSEFSPSVVQVFRLVSAFKYLYYKYELSLKMILSFEKKLFHDLIFTKNSRDDNQQDDIEEVPSLVVQTKPLPFLNIFEHYDKSKMYQNPTVILPFKSLGTYFYLLINLRRLKVSKEYQVVAPKCLDCIQSYYLAILKILVPFYNDVNKYSRLIIIIIKQQITKYLHQPFTFSDNFEDVILAAVNDIKTIQSTQTMSNSKWLELKSFYPPIFFQQEISNINQIFMKIPKPPVNIPTPISADSVPKTTPTTSKETLGLVPNKKEQPKEKIIQTSTPSNKKEQPKENSFKTPSNPQWINQLINDQNRKKNQYSTGNQINSSQKKQTPVSSVNKSKQLITSTNKNQSVSSTLKTTSLNSSKTLPASSSSATTTTTTNTNKGRDKINESNRSTISKTTAKQTETREKNVEKNKITNHNNNSNNNSANKSSTNNNNYNSNSSNTNAKRDRSSSSNRNDSIEENKRKKENPKSILHSQQLTNKNSNSSSSINQPHVPIRTVYNSSRSGQGPSSTTGQTTAIRNRSQTIAPKPSTSNSIVNNSATASSSDNRIMLHQNERSTARASTSSQSSFSGQSYGQAQIPNLMDINTARNNLPYNQYNMQQQQQQQQQFGPSSFMYPPNSIRQQNPPMSLSRRLHLDACAILGDPEPDDLSFTMGRPSSLYGVNQSVYPNIPGMANTIRPTVFDASNPWDSNQIINQQRATNIPVHGNSYIYTTQIRPMGYGNYYGFQ